MRTKAFCVWRRIPILSQFFCLENLMSQTDQGQSLTNLYWRHSREVLGLVRTNLGLLMETAQLLNRLSAGGFFLSFRTRYGHQNNPTDESID